MKKKLFLIAVMILAGVTAITSCSRQSQSDKSATSQNASATPRLGTTVLNTARLPAHYETVPSVNSLAPTLSPVKFFGNTKQAYQAAKQIPQTLAQLPCLRVNCVSRSHWRVDYAVDRGSAVRPEPAAPVQ